MDNYAILILALLTDLLITYFIVFRIYLPSEKDKGYVLTFFAFNLSIFMIATLFNQVEISIGFGFGLFAVFSILRYRSDPLPVRELTYLFILMALPVINVVLLGEEMVVETAIADVSILAVFYIIERILGFRYETKKKITYEKIELIKPEHYESLMMDLKERTGLPITRCEVGNIDFLHDVAELKIYYRLDEGNLPGMRKGN